MPLLVRLIVRAQLPLESVESARPNRSGILQPRYKIPEALGTQGLHPGLALRANGHEPSLAQHFQMLGDGRCAHIEFIDKFARRPLALCKQFNNSTACRVSDGEYALHARTFKPFLN